MAGRMKALGQVTLNQAHSLRNGRTPQPFLVHRHVQSTIIRHRNNTPVVTIHQAIPRDKIIPTLTALQTNITTNLQLKLTNRELTKLTRNLLNTLSNNNIIDLLSTILSESEQIVRFRCNRQTYFYINT
eukprot:10924_1